MALGCLCCGSFIDRFGRKMGLVICIVPSLMGWLMLGFTNNIVWTLLGRFFAGFCSGAYRPMGLVYLSEITDPKRRAIALLSTSVSSNFGVLCSHVIGSNLYWRTAAFIFGLPNILSFVLFITLKESPLWLISKGKTDKGEEIFKWFREKSETSEKELRSAMNKYEDISPHMSLRELFRILRSKMFIKPLAITTLLVASTQLSNVNTICYYALDIFGNTFPENIDSALVMVIFDCLRVGCSITTIVFSKCLPRRSTFLICGFGTTAFLVGLVFYMSFDTSNLVWLGMTCLILYICSASIMVTTAWSFVSELFPGTVRGLGSAMSSFILFILQFICVKITPDFMNTYGMPAIYAGSAIVVFVCTLILCFILPETNGKSLQEIEDGIESRK
ncbi:facilitated trehalose transporter Tret1-like isoform X2 [Galleria mellonella]|nr:facilitated trehalose transporter Tret1-like isoform X2 [Galleria mellonella]XP_052753064.1 facilitated trehalose transporter Tret1-like isoform X2 [Galleria mellonella]